MKKLVHLLAFAFSGLSFAIPENDAPGSKDYPGLPRYEGTKILYQSEQQYGELALQIGRLSSPDSTDAKEIRLVEGSLHRTTYLLENSGDARRTVLEVFRNYGQALQDAGFTTIWEGDQATIGNGPPIRHYFAEADKRSILTGVKERRYLCAEKGGLFAALLVMERSWDHTVGKAESSNPFKADVKLPTGMLIVQLDIVDTKPMEEKMVVVKAEEMQNKISDTGHIALYGIHFDFNKADIKPESEPTLSEIANLLKASPDLKILVVGHTDNAGSFDFNQDLSQLRAASVVKELVSRHGIDSGRLSPHGASFIAPVASNATEEGRAKNRRVELVEQ